MCGMCEGFQLKECVLVKIQKESQQITATTSPSAGGGDVLGFSFPQELSALFCNDCNPFFVYILHNWNNNKVQETVKLLVLQTSVIMIIK